MLKSPSLTLHIHPPKFPEGTRHIISMLSFILGYFTDEHTDESILGFLSIFVPGQPPAVIYNFAEYIVDNIHEQIVKLPTEGVFRYTSFLFQMFLYFQSEKFPMTLQNMDVVGNAQCIILWTSLTRNESKEFTYADFTYCFIHPLVNLLKNSVQPRINDEIKRVLQFS